MNAVTIIQARENSQRLPGKVSAMINGLTMLKQVIHRAKGLGYPVLTAEPHMWDGHEDDVLGRIAHVVRTQAPEADTIIRITGDCPLLDMAVSQMVVDTYARGGLDFVGTAPEWDGLDTEVFSRAALYAADEHAFSAYDREHVTPWIKTWGKWVAPLIIPASTTYRWSVDDEEGLRFVREVYAACPHCAAGTPHHTNSAGSIGGNDRRPVWDLHAVRDSGGVGLAECAAFDQLMSRTGGPVYVSR